MTIVCKSSLVPSDQKALEAHDPGYPTIDAAAVHVAAIFEAVSAGSG